MPFRAPSSGTRVPAFLLPTLLLLVSSAGFAGAQTPRAPRLEHAPALAWGDEPVIAWLAEAGTGQRVFVSVSAGSPRPLGPRRRGDDGAPAAASSSDGSVWVAAARQAGGRTRLWTQRWTDGRWDPPVPGPRAGLLDVQPAIAAGASAPWLAWVAEGPDGDGALFAARLRDGDWGPPEALPWVGEPSGAPSISVDDEGMPVVAWAASDGQDAEIWLTRRRPDATWSSPERVTDDEVPQVAPSVAVGADRVVVAWAGFGGAGYAPFVAEREAAGAGWTTPRRLSSRSGVSPRVLRSGDRWSVVWAAVGRQDPESTELMVARRDDRGWSTGVPVGAVYNARISAAAAPDGDVVLGWHAGGDVGAGRLHRNADGVRLRLLRGSLELPRRRLDGTSLKVTAGTYRAFGDSLTLGTSLVGGQFVTLAGYPAHLAALLSNAVGTPITVVNSGVGGETTVAGVGRLAGLVAASPTDHVLLMEGTNDVTARFSADTVAFNLRQMVQIVKDAGRSAVLSNVIPRAESGFGGPSNDLTNAVNARIPAIGTDLGVGLVDSHGRLLGRAGLYSDAIHPTQSGYNVIAEGFFATLDAGGGGTAGVPATATLVSPSGAIATGSPTFQWTGDPSATSFLLHVRDGANNLLVDRWFQASTVCSGTSCAASNVIDLAAGSYIFGVLSRNAQGMSDWPNPPMSFTVGGGGGGDGSGGGGTTPGAPGVATLVSPSGAIGTGSPTFQWTGDPSATSFLLHVRDSANVLVVNQWLQAADVCSGGSCSVTGVASLVPGDYVFGILSQNSQGMSDWPDPPMSFTVQ